MRIKTFRADTMRAALDIVKKELGANALILSSKEVKKKPMWGLDNKTLYEVTAALDDHPEDLKGRTSANAVSSTEVSPSATVQNASSHGTSWVDESALGEFKDELAELRRLIYSVAKPASPGTELFPDHLSYELYHKLVANDVSEWLAYKVIDAARAKLAETAAKDQLAWETAAADVIQKMIKVSPTDNLSTGKPVNESKVAIFLGPTGVGKTTTIAKLAARYVLERKAKVLLVTLDTYRIAAVDQLKVYAGIIGVPLEVLPSTEGFDKLDRLIKENRSKDVILIDTVGCSQRETARFAGLSGYLRNARGIEKHLVLSATTKSIDLHEIIDKFGIFDPDALLFTKLDETSTFGTILNEHVRTNKPLSYFTNGQKVPEDLRIPTVQQVARLMCSA